MKIESYESKQFAGMQDQCIHFEDGMNVVLGANETGKSTMIAALYHALHTPVTFDWLHEREFAACCFPSDGAETIDTRLEIEAEGEHYTAEKVWKLKERNGTFRLEKKGGAVLTDGPAEEKLKEILKYGPAVYANLVFGQQNHEDQVLDWCYRFFTEKDDADMEEIRKIVAEAFSAAGGISEEKIHTTLKNRMQEMAGHWDFQQNRPEEGRDVDRPWTEGCGTILEAYYTYRREKQAMLEMKAAENEEVRMVRRLEELEFQLETYFAQRDRLIQRQGSICHQNKTEKLLREAKSAAQWKEKVLWEWPQIEDRLRREQQLLQVKQIAARQKQKRILTERLRSAELLEEELSGLRAEADRQSRLPEDCEAARHHWKAAECGRLQLSATRLHTKLHLQKDCTVELTGSDGTTQNISGDGMIDTDGSVMMSIPQVGTIRVALQDLGRAGLQARIQQETEACEAVLARWNVSSIEELERCTDEEKALRHHIEEKEQELKRLLHGESLAALRSRIEELSGDDGEFFPDNWEQEIDLLLCIAMQPTLEAAIAADKAKFEQYTREYHSIEALQEQQRQSRKEIQKLEEEIGDVNENPEVSQEAYAEQIEVLEQEIHKMEQERINLHRRSGALSTQISNELPEIEAETERLRQIWLQLKAKYQNYETIEKDLEALQVETDYRLEEFYKRFNENLQQITDDRVSLEKKEGLQLKSGSNGVSGRELLSEGTKQAVLLSFRLAILEAFFPEGGGLIVLDDDLLDMDPDRRVHAARMLQNFAEHQQVIFTTCDPSIAELLGGNLIRK